ncbi:Mediator of RNA polymerase II transcription subunit 16 [Portunus trituberculatus]|uniref:Mediator of RNA polymerase II transcription subunit 16 n=1 Tax=Portunus trituberculatus TaxID=210409 RepID=A0A5B7DJ06_PORTR|nr:Mediator of RNA polymerase II transcription subunit 16 [Portunus trituberculatus]
MAEGDLSHCILIGLERGLTSPGSRVVRRAATKFEFKSPSVHSVVHGHPTTKSPQWAISLILLLEFALVSGSDWWDLLVSTPHTSILMLTDKLSDTFQQHSTPISQHLHIRFLVMKTSMLRYANYLESRASLDILDIEKSLDQFCSSVNVKDCQVDPGQLQNLQPLIQFAADLALFILFMLAQNSKVG